MSGKDFIAAVLIVFLSLWSMLYLETNLKNYFMLELLVILLLVIVFSGVLYAILTEKEWAWNAAAALFFAAMINSVFLYFGTRSAAPFFVALFSNLAGLVLAGSNAVKVEPINNSYKERNEIKDASETYDLEFDSLFDKSVENARKKSAKSRGKKTKKKR